MPITMIVVVPNANGWSDWSPYDCGTPAPAPALVVQPASRVNTTTAGQQSFRAIGAVADGGYTVAWISNNGSRSCGVLVPATTVRDVD